MHGHGLTKGCHGARHHHGLAEHDGLVEHPVGLLVVAHELIHGEGPRQVRQVLFLLNVLADVDLGKGRVVVLTHADSPARLISSGVALRTSLTLLPWLISKTMSSCEATRTLNISLAIKATAC